MKDTQGKLLIDSSELAKFQDVDSVFKSKCLRKKIFDYKFVDHHLESKSSFQSVILNKEVIYIKSFLSKCISIFLKIPGLVQGHNETCAAYLNAILHIGASKVKKNQVKNYEADSYGWIHAL